MAEHIKTQLRKGIEQRLRDAVPTLAAVVPAVRAERTLQSDEIPTATVDVSDGGSPVGKNVPSSRPVRRDMSVVIQIAHHGDIDEVGDLLEALQVEVEAALNDDSLILRGIHDWSYGGSTPPASQPQAGLAVLTITYTCWLSTLPGRADVII